MDDLYINLDDGSWSFDRAGLKRNEVMPFNQGDTFPLRVRFVRQASGPGLFTIVRKPTEFAVMHLSGRPVEDLEDDDLVLFDAGTWVESVVSGEYVYTGTLSLNTDSINDHLGAELEKEVLWQLELSNVSPERRWTPVNRGKGILYRDIFRATSAPTTPLPGYPEPEDIALNAGTNYRIVGGVLQLHNTSAGTWHEIHLTGAAGAEQLVISEAEA